MLIKREKNHILILEDHKAIVANLSGQLSKLSSNLVMWIPNKKKDAFKNINKKTKQLENLQNNFQNNFQVDQNIIRKFEMVFGSMFYFEDILNDNAKQIPMFNFSTKDNVLFIEEDLNTIYIKYFIEKFYPGEVIDVLMDNQDVARWKFKMDLDKGSDHYVTALYGLGPYECGIAQVGNLKSYYLKGLSFEKYYFLKNDFRNYSRVLKRIVERDSSLVNERKIFGNQNEKNLIFTSISLFGIKNVIVVERSTV
ncbi:MAG: hypothetical protein K0R18_1074 [Bacillales bacterium]|jgi:hypothetical protein|nr:hypothetical protein [Bacillales bacterium]